MRWLRLYRMIRFPSFPIEPANFIRSNTIGKPVAQLGAIAGVASHDFDCHDEEKESGQPSGSMASI